MSYNELNFKMCQMLMELSKCEREIEKTTSFGT